MVTASGSGLDPDISEAAAIMQIKRVAAYRNLDERLVAEAVVKNTEGPLFGLFGPSKVNVLKLNVALDELKK
ncbi:Potassium-transporting ATPase C chain [compost metagenome]